MLLISLLFRKSKELKTDIRSLDLVDIKKFCQENNMKPYVSNQVYSWLWNNFSSSFSQMSNLSKSNREIFNENFSINKITEDFEERSDDGTIKMRFKLYDGNFVNDCKFSVDPDAVSLIVFVISISSTIAGDVGVLVTMFIDSIYTKYKYY